MAERELNIINEARITLNDTSSEPRWTTPRLIKLLSDAQEDMCKNIPLIARKATINTYSGVTEYSLPIDSVKLLRASSDGKALTNIAYDEIERNNVEWEEDTAGSYSHVVVNALSQKTIRPYPALEVSANKSIKVSYQAIPQRLDWDEAFEDTEYELTIDSMWDLALTQYVIGMAFVDYGDESSLSRSQVAIGLYNKEYQRALKLSKKSFTKRGRTTGYQAKVVGYQGDYNGRSNTRCRY